jgi:GDP-4-dehydro-6-deoxy-D-mannose reductase
MGSGGDPILITGAAGFAGSHLLELLSGSRDVVGWSRSAPPPAIAEAARWQSVDLLDRDGVRAAVRDLRPRVVYHCAGLPYVAESWSDSASSLETNAIGTHHLLDALRRAECQCRVLVVGSATVYARSDAPLTEDSALAPASPYGRSKLAQELVGLRACVEDGIEVIVTRTFNHTGPRQRPAFVAPSIARQIALIERGAAEPLIKVGNLDAQRDLTDVRDVVRAYAALMTDGTAGRVYNVASGVAHSIRSLLDALVTRARKVVRVEIDPARLRAHDASIVIGDTTRLRSTTGWEPAISFDRMLDDLLEYWRRTV